MVPLRVKVSGFLSYRDEATLDFTGRNLWMLSGRNGVGKSAIFDAITFALFGDGRLGAKAVLEYWNHESKKNGQDALIEFDFELNGKEYRAKRTFGRGSSYAIIPLSDEKLRPLMGTEKEKGLKLWVDQNLPLSKDTFELVALLKQGKADNFLDADAKVRRSFMDKIVEMGPYSRLEAELNKELTGRTSQQKVIQKDLKEKAQSIGTTSTSLLISLNISKDDFPINEMWESTLPNLLTKLRELEKEAIAESEDQKKLLETLAGYAEQIKNWKSSADQLATWNKKKGEYQAVLDRAEELDRMRIQFELLSKVYPLLKSWSEEYERLCLAQHKHAAESLRQQKLIMLKKETEVETVSISREYDKAEIAYTKSVQETSGLAGEMKPLSVRQNLLLDNVNQANCAICNRTLTEEHIATERRKVDAELENLHERLAKAKHIEETSKQDRLNAKNKLSALQGLGKSQDQEFNDVIATLKRASQDQEDASRRIAESLEHLASIEGYPIPDAPPSAEIITSLRNEAITIKQSKPLWEKLIEARKGLGDASGYIRQIELSKERLPASWTNETYDIAETHLSKAQNIAKDKLRNALSKQQKAHDGLLTLERDWNSYIESKNRSAAVTREVRTYKALTEKLGEKFLQQHLRAEAEKTIIHYANVILQRLSQGTLYLQRNGDSGEALDLLVRDTEKTQNWLKPPALSGSQKFRLAVAIALAVGQYACKNAAGGVESVIIDEGFGSLDKENRDQMIEELHRLGTLLKRVILVSHQEEFFQAFPDQWHITFENGTAKASVGTPA
jgi:DNA repair exonuclease SbcCD ATPase subunit